MTFTLQKECVMECKGLAFQSIQEIKDAVATTTLCFNKEVFSWLLIHLLHLKFVTWLKFVVIIRIKRNTYLRDSNFHRNLTVAYLGFILSHFGIAVHVCTIWSRWVQDRHTERRAGPQRFVIPGRREDRYFTHIDLMNHRVMLRILIY